MRIRLLATAGIAAASLALGACGQITTPLPAAAVQPASGVLRLVVRANSEPCLSVLIPQNPRGIVSVGLNFGALADLSAAQAGDKLCAANHGWTIETKQIVISTRDAEQLHIIQSYWTGGDLLAVIESSSSA